MLIHKKILILITIFLTLYNISFSQIIIDKGSYKVNFSNTYHEPLYVSYILYKGGGDCSRANFSFKNDDSRIQSATDEDYKNNKYDKGHLANSEDFAKACHYSNLQPLWWQDNLKKSDKVLQ